MRNILFLLILVISFEAYSQYFNDGQEHSSLKWKRIETINFEVIFPAGFEHKAKQLAHMMEKSYEFTTSTLKHYPKKISIILHTETVKSNAFLGWAPSRIEMYTTPHQRIYSQDWIEQLAIHEYRHLIQLSMLETEMPKLLKWLFGEQAAAFLTAVYLPFWFIEGDAVAAETGLSNSGRGCLPDFHKELKAQLVDREKYSFDKAYLGSYCDNVANYYEMGYFMIGGARLLFGKTIWDDVIHNIARNPFSLNPFDKALVNNTGLRKQELYDTVFSYLTNRWKAEDQLIVPTHNQIISKKSKAYSNYKYAFAYDSLSYVAEKSSLSDINRFVLINENGEEKVLYTPGYHFEESVSGRNHLLVWSERLSHPRWQHSDLSLIRLLNIKTGELKEYKFDAKFFCPTISPDMKKIAVVEADIYYHFYLVLIDLETGEIIKKLKTSENDFFITPSWSADGNDIISVLMKNNLKAIAKININSEKVNVVLPYANQEIIKPIEYNEGIFYIAGYTGIDNLFLIKRNDPQIYSVISSRFGIRDHSFNENNIVYSNYTSNGYCLVKTCFDSIKYKAIDIQNIHNDYPIANTLRKQEKGIIDFSNIKYDSLQVSNYYKPAHLFNFHSWAPLSIDPYNHDLHPGISVMSQNKLSTTEFMAGYKYYLNDQQGEMYAKIRYLAWLPVFDIEATHSSSDSYYFEITNYQSNNGNIVKIDTIKKEFHWDKTNFSVNSYIPFNLSKGKYRKKIQPRLKYNLSNINSDNFSPNNFPSGNYQTLETGLYMYQIMNSSKQDLLPDLGVIFDISYLISLPGVANFGSLFAISNYLYLPGIRKNHGITLYNGFQVKERAEYAFSDKVRYPRGHMHSLNNVIYTLASDYQMPIYYPDLSIGKYIYLKRLRIKAFYDVSFFNWSDNKIESPILGKLQSTGLELISDVNILRFIATIELGVRSSYLFDKKLKFDFLFNIEFSF